MCKGISRNGLSAMFITDIHSIPEFPIMYVAYHLPEEFVWSKYIAISLYNITKY